jgi:hypothetical protein
VEKGSKCENMLDESLLPIVDKSAPKKFCAGPKMMIRIISIVVLVTAILCIAGLSQAGPMTWPVISKYDFYNRTYRCDRAVVKLKSGQYRPHLKRRQEIWWLAYLDYADMDGDGKIEAIVSLRNIPSSSKLWTDDVFIFTIVKGQLHQVGHLWQEDLESISVVDGSLVIVAPYWSEDDAHCCPSEKERAVFALKNGKLEKVSSTFTKIERK